MVHRCILKHRAISKAGTRHSRIAYFGNTNPARRTRATDRSVPRALYPSSDGMKGTGDGPSNIGACNIDCSPSDIKPSDQANAAPNIRIIRTKCSDDGHAVNKGAAYALSYKLERSPFSPKICMPWNS